MSQRCAHEEVGPRGPTVPRRVLWSKLVIQQFIGLFKCAHVRMFLLTTMPPAHSAHAANSVASTYACFWPKAWTHTQRLSRQSACGRQTGRKAREPKRCRAVEASSAVEPAQEASTGPAEVVVQTAEPYISHTWRWRDHAINYAVCIR